MPYTRITYDDEWEEYAVLYILDDGSVDASKTYHTEDKDDALCTQRMIERQIDREYCRYHIFAHDDSNDTIGDPILTFNGTTEADAVQELLSWQHATGGIYSLHRSVEVLRTDKI